MLCYVRSFMFVVKVKLGQCKNYSSIIVNLVDEDNWSAVGCMERHASRLFLRQCDIIKLKLSITLQKVRTKTKKINGPCRSNQSVLEKEKEEFHFC